MKGNLQLVFRHAPVPYSSIKRLGQEDCEFELSPGYITRPWHKQAGKPTKPLRLSTSSLYPEVYLTVKDWVLFPKPGNKVREFTVRVQHITI